LQIEYIFIFSSPYSKINVFNYYSYLATVYMSLQAQRRPSAGLSEGEEVSEVYADICLLITRGKGKHDISASSVQWLCMNIHTVRDITPRNITRHSTSRLKPSYTREK
jgi:hypothetical protein